MNQDAKRDIQISKTLSYLLRHGAVKENLPIDSKGYVAVDDLLRHRKLKSYRTTVDDIRRVVETNNKRRFNLEHIDNRLYICANQGHSIEITEDNLMLLKDTEIPLDLFHGTYNKNLELINKQGLKVMNRNHIHLTTNMDYIRKSCNVLIYLDIERCLHDGIKFYKSLNDVYLTKGNHGVLDSVYFRKIVKLEP